MVILRLSWMKFSSSLFIVSLKLSYIFLSIETNKQFFSWITSMLNSSIDSSFASNPFCAYDCSISWFFIVVIWRLLVMDGLSGIALHLCIIISRLQ